eukprot:gene31017-27824_t
MRVRFKPPHGLRSCDWLQPAGAACGGAKCVGITRWLAELRGRKVWKVKDVVRGVSEMGGFIHSLEIPKWGCTEWGCTGVRWWPDARVGGPWAPVGVPTPRCDDSSEWNATTWVCDEEGGEARFAAQLCAPAPTVPSAPPSTGTSAPTSLSLPGNSSFCGLSCRVAAVRKVSCWTQWADGCPGIDPPPGFNASSPLYHLCPDCAGARERQPYYVDAPTDRTPVSTVAAGTSAFTLLTPDGGVVTVGLSQYGGALCPASAAGFMPRAAGDGCPLLTNVTDVVAA